MQIGLRHVLTLALLAAAVPLAGCQWWPTPTAERPRITLHPMPPDPSQAQGGVYRLQLYYLTERLADDQKGSDFWRFFDETAVAPLDHRLLARNGLRVGIAGEIAIDRLNRLVEQSKDLEVQIADPVLAHQGYALDVPYGAMNQDITLFCSRADGSLFGGDLAKATTYIRFQCQAGPDPDSTLVRVTPWAIHGELQPAYKPAPSGIPLLSHERPRFWMPELDLKLPLREGQALAVGPAVAGDMSIGHYLFVRPGRPFRFQTTMILFPQLVAPGAVPAGAAVAGETPGPASPKTQTGGAGASPR